jgi:hypothetical protein
LNESSNEKSGSLQSKDAELPAKSIVVGRGGDTAELFGRRGGAATLSARDVLPRRAWQRASSVLIFLRVSRRLLENWDDDDRRVEDLDRSSSALSAFPSLEAGGRVLS